MIRHALRIADVEEPASAPHYELRVRTWGAGDDEYEIWQLPAPASPHLRSPVRVAGLRGRHLELVQHRVLRRLAEGGVRLRPRRMSDASPGAYAVTEHLALMLGLLFRTLAPMRSGERMARVAAEIEVMGREEAAYWLGMAMHRGNPRRVLSALRWLLSDPSRSTPTR